MPEQAKCKNCRNYRRIDDGRGDCYGHVVNGETDAAKCPTQSYSQKDNQGNLRNS